MAFLKGKLFSWSTVSHIGYGIRKREFCAGLKNVDFVEISSTLVHSVHSLYISCYVSSNKLVLSNLLLRLLQQHVSVKKCSQRKLETIFIRAFAVPKMSFFLRNLFVSILSVECVYLTEPKATCRPEKIQPNAYNMYTVGRNPECLFIPLRQPLFYGWYIFVDKFFT